MKISTTIGYERANNAALSIVDEDEFVTQALGTLGPQLPNFEAIVDLNRGPLLTDGVELLRLRTWHTTSASCPTVLLPAAPSR